MPDDNKNGSIHDNGLPRPEPPKPINIAEHFETPEQVAEQDSQEQSRAVVGHHSDNFDPHKTSVWQKLKSRWQKFSKKQKVLISSLIIIVVLAIACGVVLALKHKPAPKPAAIKQPTLTVKPAVTNGLVASNLTGLPVEPSVNNRPVTGVMIENSDFARPQSGLDQAGVVFEAIAEAGITRFLALFQDTQPNYIGPIRSARPYYLQWCQSFDCALAHVGGSPEALSDIKAWDVKNLDQFYNSGYYERITSRYAPHNVYTSIAQLNALETKLGFGAAHYTGFVRKPDAPSQHPNATSIDFSISGPDYSVHYAYNSKYNVYSRFEGGAPHYELTKTGQKISIKPKVVIAMVMQYSLESDGYHSDYVATGSGKAYVFQDGTVTVGQWNKPSRQAALTFTTPQGQPLALDAGQTWITAVGSSNDVTYK